MAPQCKLRAPFFRQYGLMTLHGTGFALAQMLFR